MGTGIIEAASVSVKTMADGTLRLSVDIEPRHAREAFGLFGSPGTPMALAALKPAAAVVDEPEKPKGGPLAKDAAIICGTHDFQRFARHMGHAASEDGASDLVRQYCGVDSRAYLDHLPDAARKFATLMRQFNDWKAA
jgi:hypothetical protein